MPGGFLPQNETLDASGHWINFHAGVFLYTANIIVKNTMAKERYSYVHMFEGRASPAHYMNVVALNSSLS